LIFLDHTNENGAFGLKDFVFIIDHVNVKFKVQSRVIS
jgi:hypothetical protein